MAGEILSNPALGRDQARLWADPILGGVEVTACRFIEHAFAPHTHDSLMIGLIEAGAKSFARERTNYVVAAGGISLVNPGEMHTGSRVGGTELRYRALYVSPRLLDSDSSVIIASPTILDPELFRSLWAATEALIVRVPSLEREERLLDAISLIRARYGERAAKEPPASPALGRVREILSEVDGDLSIEDIARAVDLSPYHLMRSFRDQFGMTMHAFRLGVRVEQAKGMLRVSDEPIANVALDCGFADQSHFTRRFKKTVGVTPLMYRNAHRASESWAHARESIGAADDADPKSMG